MKDLSDKAIEEFKAIYKKEFGRDLRDPDARQQAESVVKLVGLALKVPIEAITTVDNYDLLDRALRWKAHKDKTGKDDIEFGRRLALYFAGEPPKARLELNRYRPLFFSILLLKRFLDLPEEERRRLWD